MQFHQFARVVEIRIARDGDVIVEIDQHRRAERARREQIRESPHRIGTNDLAIISHLEPGAVFLVDVDVEVVAPELNQPLEELTLGEDRTPNGRLGQRVDHLAHRVLIDLRIDLRQSRQRCEHRIAL